VEFNKIRLHTTDSGTQLVDCHSKEYTYKWSNPLWEVNITNYKQVLINPTNFSRPITEPNAFGQETEYQDHLERILSQPDNFSIDAQYWESLETTKVNSSLPSLTSQANTLEELSCLCGIDLCSCTFPQPDTPPTPGYILLWNPSEEPRPIKGVHYQRTNTSIQSG